ncbi:hypothetical protein LINPERHAP2_LOCUS7651, partial [Linum perenne]
MARLMANKRKRMWIVVFFVTYLRQEAGIDGLEWNFNHTSSPETIPPPEEMDEVGGSMQPTPEW